MNNHPDFDHLPEYNPFPTEAHSGIDWDLIMEITPALFSASCWILWGAFLLIPSIFGLHGTDIFTTANNVVFVMMGFCFCIYQSTAIRAGHGARAVFFAIGLFLLSYWF